jgi:transposase
LDAISHQLVTVTNDSYINAHSVCLLMQKLRELNPHLPIVLILDNARYQKCKIVCVNAQMLEIELLYLPPYSPNLNLIERLWKFVKKQCLYSVYYADFHAFKLAITQCLDHTLDTYKDELDSLLTLNFQTFDNTNSFSSMTV